MKSYLVFFVMLLMGCEMTVNINVPSTKMIVVDGVFNPDSTWAVTLSVNQYVLNKSSQVDLIKDNDIQAVTIRDEKNALVETLQYKPGAGAKRKYIGQKKPVINQVYKIEIKTNSYGTVTASGMAPRVVPITSAKIDSIKSGEKNRMVTVEFVDDGATANFYELYIVGKDSHYLPLFSISDPAYSDNITDNHTLIFDDALFNGKPVKFTLKLVNTDDQVKQVVLRNISKDIYKTVVAWELQIENKGNPLAQSAVLVQGNIQNGYGIFAGYTASAYWF